MKQHLNLKHEIGQGISTRKFMDSMQNRAMELSNIPDTKELFIQTYENFTWTQENDRQFFDALNKLSGLHCLILCTDWCPDVIWNVPVLFRVMEQSGIPTEVLIMEEHLDTMDLFLTNGGRAQPIAVFLKTSGEVLGRWGARPAYIQAVMDQFKSSHPDKQHPDYEKNIQHVYREIGKLYLAGKEYQNVMIQELRELFTALDL
ncbi:thioredoxin family protein [Paenibacillus fonticola]|uniref:thioredoxin family protein n=1 Tax=Paenibacillus fonticola TaxID=379896 RepID=UPI0004757DBC|nr:thioredoxin family protein [Paenibacillus fonticola]